MPTWILIAFAAALAWLGFAALARWVMVNPRGQEADAGLMLAFIRCYSRVLHRVEYEGLEHVRAVETTRPLIVVANHTAGIDPVLIQNATRRFEPRWMMADDMRVALLEPFWNWVRIIDVARYQKDSASARVALKHLKAGGVLGIFPEGGIERPARQLLPFQPGVGLLIKKSGALVLPAIIEDTPQIDPAFASIWTPSRSRVRFMEPVDYASTGLGAADIAADLQQRYEDWTGWPINRDRADGVETPQPSADRHQREAPPPSVALSAS
ncbi:MAG: lysophospholipid acyltransferase family protein [Planctomycetota bacterium]